jgi:hypothetical protein
MYDRTVRATTSCVGTQLSRAEMALSLDRHDLVADTKLVNLATMRDIENYKQTTLGKILSSDKFIKFDMLAHNVIAEGFAHSTKVLVGSNGKTKEIKIGEQQFRQVDTTYFGDINS